MDFVKLNGTAVRLSGFHQRIIAQENGPPLQELELVVILRGTMAHRSFLALLGRGQIRIDLPDPSGVWTTYDTEIEASLHTSSGPGEAAAFRHDVTLRETPEGAARRAAAAPAVPEPAPPASTDETPAEDEPEEDPDAPADLSTVKVSGNATAWATALRQMTSPGAARPAAPEPPLETPELAGAEAVLVGLRIEALIEQLVAAGLVRRSAVEASFMRLVQTRFVAEATPVIGEKAAKRAAKSVVES